MKILCAYLECYNFETLFCIFETFVTGEISRSHQTWLLFLSNLHRCSSSHSRFIFKREVGLIKRVFKCRLCNNISLDQGMLILHFAMPLCEISKTLVGSLLQNRKLASESEFLFFTLLKQQHLAAFSQRRCGATIFRGRKVVQKRYCNASAKLLLQNGMRFKIQLRWLYHGWFPALEPYFLMYYKKQLPCQAEFMCAKLALHKQLSQKLRSRGTETDSLCAALRCLVCMHPLDKYLTTPTSF